MKDDTETIRELVRWHLHIAAMFRKVLPFSLNKESVARAIDKEEFHAWVLSLAL